MNVHNKSYKFRIYLNKNQKSFVDKNLGCCRLVYNHFLAECIRQYKETGKSDNYNKQSAALTVLKHKIPQNEEERDYRFLKEVIGLSLHQSLRNLDTSWQNFFKKKSAFPNFKSKKGKNAFTIPQDGKIVDGKIKIPKLKDGIKVKMDREVIGEIRSMTISSTSTGKYFVSILTKQEIKMLPKTNRKVGVDLGLKDFLITSDEKKFKNNKYTKKYAKELKRMQQHLSRKEKGSNGFEKQKLKVAALHEKVANSRTDNLHKVSTELINSYDFISVENLHVKGMIKNRKLSKHIADASWGNFVDILEYKCKWYGKELVKIDRFYPSSKTCHSCGWIKDDMILKNRVWTCNGCNTTHDRDINAAINIKKEGLKIYGQGLSITKVERKSDFSNKAHSVKPEAQINQ